MHPSLKFLAPAYNAGQLALIHRVGYPKQSRSHFDSQNYWENGTPNNNLIKDGIFYRAMIESGLAASNPLTGVSIQSALPLILRGDAAAMTNISNVSRYALLGVPGGTGLDKSEAALRLAQQFGFAPKQSRELLKLQYANLLNTLPLFEQIATLMNVNYVDDAATDGDFPYTLFPVSNATNGGYTRPQVAAERRRVADLLAREMVGGLGDTLIDLHTSQTITIATKNVYMETLASIETALIFENRNYFLDDFKYGF